MVTFLQLSDNIRPAVAEFCQKFEETYPDATEIVKSLDESTSTDADAELIEELEEQVLYYIILYCFILYFATITGFRPRNK